MKINVLLALLIVVGTYLTCKNLKNQAPAATAKEEPNVYSNSGYNWKASHVVEGDNPSSLHAYQVKKAPARVQVPWQSVTPPSTSRKAFMSTGWWIPKFAFQASDTTVHEQYIHKAIKFKEDQTFDLFVKGKVTETGNWAYDDEKKILYLSCNDTYFNNTWKVQENGFRMVLLGNTDLNVTGIQVRLDGTKTDPAAQ